MMERKLEKVINLFANAIFGDFLNYYVVEFLMCYGNKNWKSGNFVFNVFFASVAEEGSEASVSEVGNEDSS